ncbi:hypothetical protein HHI36_004765 [Cryptolaemus montrouzieri]|uniref:Uncharacterized protein n=1 Tax=Cryptolaemus montrouzieri TaxID=559131 RepID=A0ABD2NS43_9CUCU
MENALQKWTVTQTENSQEYVANDDVLAHPSMSGNNSRIESKADSPVSPFQQDWNLSITTSPSSEIQIEEAAATDKVQLNMNNHVPWLG